MHPRAHCETVTHWLQQHSVWDEALCLVVHCYLGCPWLLGETCSGSVREKCFHEGSTNLPIVADVNLSYAAKSPNSTWVSSLIWTILLIDGVMFVAVRLCLRYECRDSLRLSWYSFCQNDQNWSSLFWPFFRIERRRVMLSMGLKSRSSTSSTVVTNNAVELVTATKGLGVRTCVISP